MRKKKERTIGEKIKWPEGPEIIAESDVKPFKDKEMKKYCKNCKYSKYYDNEELKFKIDFNYGNWFCSFKDKVVIDCIGDKITIGDFSTSACQNINRTFDCKHYKRKWWKFWIKDEKDLTWKKYRNNLPLRGPTL